MCGRFGVTCLLVMSCGYPKLPELGGDGGVTDGGSGSGGDLVIKDIPTTAALDILFVVDNSSSTADKQSALGSSVASFVTALDAFPAGRPDLHIGVVDTTVDIGVSGFGPGCPHPDPNDNGALQAGAACAVGGTFITDIANPDGGRDTNYTGDLATQLACIATVGDTGCGFEAPLNALHFALDGSVAANASFLRPGAELVVVILTDEDDASVKPGSAGSAVFTLPAEDVGGLDDFRVQPMFAYACDQPITAGSGSAAYTNCIPRTDSYLQDPTTYTQFLQDLKGGVGRSVVGVIAGPPPLDAGGNPFATDDSPALTAGDAGGTSVAVFGAAGQIENGPLTVPFTQDPALLPSCAVTDSNGDVAVGRPGVRLANFEEQLGDHGRYYSVCQPTYSGALDDIATTAFDAISPCLHTGIATTDIDPSNPGPQLACSVSAVQDLGEPDQSSTNVPVCRMMSDGTTPIQPAQGQCFYIASDAACTGFGLDGYSVRFEPPMAGSAGLTMEVECSAAP